ncbi:hypothetical protein Micbo1qcDRAFT_58952 [Microdochium bolleyi]|uniref:C3H1-type domain-containing protein n=1 Tax=Microdochium bolleyi TaxID=196109 RepID=A0A136J4A3_9PEZI|nr:hypothetical protein Micbo1qcDRAFT_58952 [Microdochium bolleyi]
MSNSYPYGPPPPPPPPSAAPSAPYPSYGQTQGYSGGHHHRGGHGGGGHGRGRGGGGYNQGQNRRDYGQPYHDSSSYAQPASSAPAYGGQAPSGYWAGAPQGAPAVPHHGSPPLPASNYHPNYAPQPYGATPQGYQPPYHSQPNTPHYGQAYAPPPHEYSSQQQWAGGAPPYASQHGRGGRDGHHGGRGPPKPEYNAMGPPIRMGFDKPGDQSKSANSYAPPFPPQPYQQPSLPNLPAPVHQPYGGRSQPHHGHNNRGRGGHKNNNNRDNKNRSAHPPNDKARPHGQRPQGDHSQQQKGDHANSKKKKRKTNTLGLTPVDGHQSDEGPEDDEAYMQDYLGQEVPNIPDMAEWIAARKANYPTKARIAEKKASEDAKRAEQAAAAKAATPKVDPMQEKAEKLRRQLERVERKLEKRKREANDEGDEMRVDDEDSDSDDEAPETLSSKKAPNASASGNANNRADPTTHCKYYATGGNCGKKDKCRFVHDPAVRASALEERNMNKGRMTLKQRLILNDKDHEDMQVVKAIVQLRADGRM